MENVYDIVHRKGLMFILPEDVQKEDIPEKVLSAAAAAVYLYYAHTLERYLAYIENIPEKMDVYLISANQEIWDRLQVFADSRRNVKLIKKENRGRDVSALLVTFRKFALKYKYFCFVHDKKPHAEYLADDVEFWIENLWGSTLKSGKYICNILGLLERKEHLGLLVPQNPMGKYFSRWYMHSWAGGGNFEHTKAVADELGLVCNIDEAKMSITLGTVFWARTEALRKLLEKEWRHEDFPEEPLPMDGTLSHAIERVLAYVAQDAGFETGIVSCAGYAEKMLLKLQQMMTDSFAALGGRFGIRNVYQLLHYESQEKLAESLFGKCKRVYLYGAGIHGERYLSFLERCGHTPGGFAVTDGHKKTDTFQGYPVIELGKLDDLDNTGIIITVSYMLKDVMEENLRQKGFKHYYAAALGQQI